MTDLVRRVVKRPWNLLRHRADKFMTREVLAQPNVRLAILDDQAVDENDRGRLLAQIRKHFSGTSLLYIAGIQSDANEKRARTNGAHYYVSKPLSLERFEQVLRSFLHAQQVDGRSARPAGEKFGMSAKESNADNPAQIDAGIRRLSAELNREDSDLRSHLLDAALAGLRLTRNSESLELRRDAARIWVAIEPILTHHLDAEDGQLLPWLERHGRLSSEVGRKVREYHDRLRTLVGAMANAEAEHLTDVQAREVGRALSGLAVKLDDAIDDEERRLFPTIRKALFGIDHRG
ncbi:MAG: hemerythrin domain-containing protein [Candidatus Binatus sp.]|uniref:hemerythrin domain-containing protein n=1 Tax=Candidatus Binatus sp. TaxID=2811406 RepID=UPI0027190859|nr:hemerythrin domain-containing protein [Candidatus Binatus sp.]MDO8434578.1 hemerythrin domain-containing protein [Candidatus Binatus sp.]